MANIYRRVRLEKNLGNSKELYWKPFLNGKGLNMCIIFKYLSVHFIHRQK